MGACVFIACPQDTKAMQSTMDRMAGSRNQKDRMVKSRRREAATSGKVDANTMEDYCTNCWSDSYTMSRTIPAITWRCRSTREQRVWVGRSWWRRVCCSVRRRCSQIEVCWGSNKMFHVFLLTTSTGPANLILTLNRNPRDLIRSILTKMSKWI